MNDARHSGSVLSRVFREIFFLCTVFVAEVYLLRHFITIDSSIPVNNAVIPSLCALVMLSYLSAETAPLEISVQKKTFLLNALLFPAFFILNLNITPVISSLGWPAFIVLWLAAAVLTLGSSFFVLVKPSSLYAKLKAYPVETGLGILAGLSQFLYGDGHPIVFP